MSTSHNRHKVKKKGNQYRDWRILEGGLILLVIFEAQKQLNNAMELLALEAAKTASTGERYNEMIKTIENTHAVKDSMNREDAAEPRRGNTKKAE